MRLHSSILLILAVCTCTAADEVAIRDLRLGVYGMGKSASLDYTWDDGYGSASGTDSIDADSHGRVALTYVAGQARPVGLIVGIGLAVDGASYDFGEGVKEDWAGIIINGQVGAAFVLNRHLHVEAAAILGLGGGQVELKAPGWDIDPATAGIYEYGVRLGGYGTFGSFQVGLEAGWMSTHYVGAEWDIPQIGMTYSEDAGFSGAFAGLTLGIRL